MQTGPLILEKVPQLAAADLIVIGGGTAGCCAALAACTSGVRSVILIERYSFLGGTSTQMLDTFYGFFTPGNQPRKVVGGTPDCVVDALDAAGAVFLRPNTYGAGTGVNYNPERLKLVWDNLLSSAGVRVLLHSTMVAAEADTAGRIIAVVLSTKRGFVKVCAPRFIDASGDADLCHLAGVPYEKAGENEPAQTLTTTFRMSNVDLAAYEKAGGKKLLAALMADAVNRGTYALPRKSGSFHEMNAHGCVSTVAVRVAEVDATDFEQLTLAEQEGRRQAFVYESFVRDRVPGFAMANIIGLSHQIGVRETRRVFGEYRLTRNDCLSVARFEDRVLLCGAPIEDHRAAHGTNETEWNYVPGGEAYDVPYRTLVPCGRDELWVVGRCFSATHDAHASCRSMAQTMAMGQAAGTAAALATANDCSARSVPIPRLQAHLRKAGVILETPTRTAKTGRNDWRANCG